MTTNTYVAIDTRTLASPASSVVFNSIPQTYTDLVLVVAARDTRTELNDGFGITFNTDTSTGSTNYSDTYIYGGGTGIASGRNQNQRNISVHQVTGANVGSTTFGTGIVHIMNYSNTTTCKSVLNRGGVDVEIYMGAGLWRSTEAISTMTLYPGYNGSGYSFSTGSTFSLYGIQAGGGDSTPKATGGTVTSDSTYYYHTFAGASTFTPLQSLTADILLVAGGGGGGAGTGTGGGGAGGMLELTSQSLTATPYTVLVGAGGAISVAGSNSSFGALTAAVGGGQGGTQSSGPGGNGGSGGGGQYGGSTAGGSATSGQGNAGGQGFDRGANSTGGGGGGGKGGAGQSNPNTSYGGAGGIGATSSISGGATTGAGQLSGGSYYFAGGGGGAVVRIDGFRIGGDGGLGGGGNSGRAGNAISYAGTANTGGGGGGSQENSTNLGSGGSGIVIVRYLKA